MNDVGLTREGLTAHDLAMLGKMQDAISDETRREKPTLAEMREWADVMEARERNGLHAASCVNGYVPTAYVRPLANARALVRFLEWCIKYREDIEILARAIKHREARQR